jgi:N utilization substance protein B
MEVLAPGWPAHRQPAVDRAILRLAHYELKLGKVHPKIIVNEAIELAKEFSTDKSPAFVNGLLDKVLHQVLPAWEAAHGKEISPEAVPDAAD